MVKKKMNGLHLKARLNALSPPLFSPLFQESLGRVGEGLKKKKNLLMIHPQVHLRIPCYDFSFL